MKHIEKERRTISLPDKKRAAHRNPSSPARKYFGPYKKLFDEVVDPSQVVFSPNLVHDTLNPDIWNPDKTLKKEVRIKLLKIAQKFHEFLKIDFKIKDVVFTGSMVNYNWASTSDIDLHLLLHINGSEDEQEFIQEYLVAKKTIWNFVHDIKIKGIEVEVYAKDEESDVSSKGIFSLTKNKWIKEPKKEDPIIDAPAVKEKAATLMSAIDKVSDMADGDSKLEKAQKISQKVKLLRTTGLQDKGEYSTENLAFKVLRNNGFLQKLSDIKVNSFDNEMSIEEMLMESDKNKNMVYDYGCLMVYFDIPGWEILKKGFKESDIYDKEGFGFECEPHATVLYGFHKEVTLKNIKKALKGVKQIKAKTKNITHFKNDEYDVVKFDLESVNLNKLNKKFTKFPHTTDCPDYHPHMTLSYVKKGKGKKYDSKDTKSYEFIGTQMVFSTADGKKHKFKLEKGKLNEYVEVEEEKPVKIKLGFEKDIEGMSPRKKELIKLFVNFAVNRLDLQEDIELHVHKGRDEYIATTASYVPSENSNHVKGEGRATVDIMRSVGHEFTHNLQRQIGKFKVGETTQNIGGELEDEANAIAGILIKDFTHNYGYDEIYDE